MKNEASGSKRNTQNTCDNNAKKFVNVVKLPPVIPGQSLQDKRPDIAGEWDKTMNYPITPDMIAVGSNFHAWWKCKNEHLFPARIAARAQNSKSTSCPYCSGRHPIIGETDFKTKNEFWAAQWDYETNPDRPEDLTWCSGKIRNFICPQCHQSFPMQISKINRATKKPHCPFCNHEKYKKGVNDLATEHKELVDFWDKDRNGRLDPSDVMAAGTKKYWWKCENGFPHSYETLIPVRIQCGCPYCSNNKCLPGFNDLDTRFHAIAEEWDYEKNGSVKPSEIMPGNQNNFWWICPSCGKHYRATPDNRTHGHGCRECWNRFGTSWPEQVFFYYVRKSFPDTQIHYLDEYELDVYVPSKQLGIEYDGQHHMSKLDSDQGKNAYFRSKGITLIRIREEGLPDISGCKIYHCKKSPDYPELEGLVRMVLCQELGVQEKFTDIKIKRDFNEIYSSYRQNMLNESLESRYPALVKSQWDFERNGCLLPSQIAPGCNQHKVWWHCSKGHVFQKEPLPMVKSFLKHSSTEGCQTCWLEFLRNRGPRNGRQHNTNPT